MAMNSRERRQLAASAHRLKPSATISAGEPHEGVLTHLREALRTHETIKVRIQAADREAFAQTAAQLAERIPCELVQRIGRVVVLHRGAAEHGAVVSDMSRE